jgi:P27 family predicted phage terminase small subunit
MPAGRPPKPKAIKELQGTHRKSRDLPNEMGVAPLLTVPLAPDTLPESAHKYWYKAATELLNLKVLSVLDLDMLHAYCYQLYVLDLATEELKAGYTIIMQNKGGGVYPVKSPWVSIYNDALGHAKNLALQFGLTPSSRTKISVGQVKEEKKNPFDGF